VNDIPDNEPWSGNYPYNTGNTVVIQKDNYFLLLGHLKKDSIRVKEGDDVRCGEPIASAGNSGYSERPHLHMQLIKSESPNYWGGTGISIRYKNRNLYKNRPLPYLPG
jgi:murein DD-endopeptidase MepM/ murein hydrolase activator NlpD